MCQYFDSRYLIPKDVILRNRDHFAGFTLFNILRSNMGHASIIDTIISIKTNLYTPALSN